MRTDVLRPGNPGYFVVTSGLRCWSFLGVQPNDVWPRELLHDRLVCMPTICLQEDDFGQDDMNSVFVRIFAKRAVPRYRRRHFARRLSSMPKPAFLAKCWSHGALVGAMLTLLAERFL
jgi:hypothetical protein